MRLARALTVTAWLTLLVLPAWGAPSAGTEKRLTLPFEAFTHRAVYLQPNTPGPHPTVLLLPGSGPVDVDTELYARLAHLLAEQGVASFRFDKRFVSPNSTPAQDQAAMRVGPRQHLDDADAAFHVLREQLNVAASCVFVYGHSEGSTVAAALRERRPDLAGLILHAPVTLDWLELHLTQVQEVQLPALRALVGRELSSVALAEVLNDARLTPVRSLAELLVDPAARARSEVRVDARLDANGDGTLDLIEEVPPALVHWLASASHGSNPFYRYGDGRGLPSVTAQTARLRGPVLVLQGERDGWTPGAYLSVLEAAWPPGA